MSSTKHDRWTLNTQTMVLYCKLEGQKLAHTIGKVKSIDQAKRYVEKRGGKLMVL